MNYSSPILKTFLIQCCVYLISLTIINISSLPRAKALDLETVFSTIVYDVISLEYEKKNLKALENYMEHSSLEELIFSAEQHNPSAQKMLFYVYYLVSNTLTNIIRLNDKIVLQLNPAQVIRIENLIKKTSTAEAYFSLGFSYILNGDKTKGFQYLNKAKNTGYALAYLVIPALKIKKEETFPNTKKQNIDIIYQSLQEMQEKDITIIAYDFLMGIVLFLKKQRDEALKFFDSSINKQKYAIPASLAYIGMIHHINNRIDLAKDFYVQALKAGNDTSRTHLIKIYIQEGNFALASKLLEDISTKWGKYTDATSIKASFLLSYMLSEGIGLTKDLKQSYVYANRAKKIYLMSDYYPQQFPLLKMLDPSTGRYQIWLHPDEQLQPMDNFSKDLESHIKPLPLTSKHTLPKKPKSVFELMNFKNNQTLTEKQLQVIDSHISSLTEHLKKNNKLQEARFLASADFESLYIPSSKCGFAFLN